MAADWLALTEPFGLREVVRLVLLSGLSTIVCVMAYPRNAPTRRLLVLCVVGVLTALPFLLLLHPLEIALPMESPLTWSEAVPGWFLGAWLAVALVLIVREFVLTLRTQQSLLAAPPMVEPRVRAMLSEGRISPEDLLIRSGTRAIPGPSSASLLQPIMVLPAESAGWPDTTLRAVVYHELVHIDRRDDLWALLVRLLCHLYWWMPWLRVLKLAFERALEESCDDYASEHFGENSGYVHGLVDGAGRCVERPTAEALSNLGSHPLLGRVRRFSGSRTVEIDSRGAYWATLVLIVGVLFITSFKPVGLPDPVITYQASSLQLTQHVWPVTPAPSIQARLTGDHASRYQPRLPQPLPVYPGPALLEEIEGEVVLEFSVGADGYAYRAEVAYESHPGVFAGSALKALRSTTYNKVPQSPALDPRPHRSPALLRQTYVYRLRRF